MTAEYTQRKRNHTQPCNKSRANQHCRTLGSMNVVGPGTYLSANLRALAEVAPALAERISWPVGGDHVGTSPDGSWHYRWHQRWLPLEMPDADRALLVEGAAASPQVAVLGLGDPRMVHQLLAQNAQQTLYAWDRDPWLVRLFLGAMDFSQPLRAGTLRLLMGIDLVTSVAFLARCTIVQHPLLAQLYSHERRLIDAEVTLPLAFVARGGLFVDDVADSLWEKGYRVYTLDLHGCATDELAFAVSQSKPRLLAAINYTEGLAEFCQHVRLPLLCWEVDPSTSALPACQTPTSHAFIFTYRQAHVKSFKRAGFEHAEYLPLAANPRRRMPLVLDDAERSAWGGGRPTYVGSSIGLEIPRFRAAFDAVVARATGSADPHPAIATTWLEHALAAQRKSPSRLVVAAALDEMCPSLGTLAGGTAVQAAAEIAASEKRLRYAAALGHLGMRVWGDEGWRLMDAVAPGHKTTYMGSAGHLWDITRIYNASAVNIDVGRVYQSDIVTMRVFDIAACGGFVLADWSEALAAVFKVGDEIECHRSFDELEEKTRHYLAHPEQAQGFARKSRAAVLGRHTIAGRVGHMLSVLKSS